MLAAPLAALVGIGGASLWRLRAAQPWPALGLLLIAGGTTLALQLQTAQAFVGMVWWLAPSLALFATGLTLSAIAALRAWRYLERIGWGTVLSSLLLIPAIWAGLTTLNPSSNQSLPSAYSGSASAPASSGALHVNTDLIAYLQANTVGVRYLMATPSAMQGSDYVLATGRPVLYMGGFMGQDQVLSVEKLARLVADGELRYIYWSADGRGGMGGAGGQSDISSWIVSSCAPVGGFTTATRNMGAPGGTEATTDNNAASWGQSNFGSFQIQLYDCAET